MRIGEFDVLYVSARWRSSYKMLALDLQNDQQSSARIPHLSAVISLNETVIYALNFFS